MYKQQLKIAFLSNQISWGGAPMSLLLLIKAISKQNYKLYLFVTHCVSDEMKKEFEKYVEFVKLVYLPEITSAQTQSVKQNKQEINVNNFDLPLIEQFAVELNHLDVDILHINNSVFSPIYETIRIRTRVKIISHIREWIDWNGIHQKQFFLINSIKDNSDAIICISKTESEVFIGHPNVIIIPNPFDFQEYKLSINDRNFVRYKLGFDHNYFLVGMIGRSTKSKGTLDFLKALAYLKKRYKDDVLNIKFIILGEANPTFSNIFILLVKKMFGKTTYSNTLYKLLKKENLFNDVVFFNKRKDALEIINIFDVAVRPSYSGDPWGRDIIEYMALKKPVVATGSSEFFIKNGETGFLVPPRDSTQLAEKIYWLLKNKNAGKAMGQRAFIHIFSLCNMDIFRSKVLQVYNDLMKFKN
jgi:glycosyltransferase involved in cell wall biosynthesis